MQQFSDDYGYAQTVRVGSTIWVSGQSGFGPEGIPASVEDQSRLAFENLHLVGRGGTFTYGWIHNMIREGWQAVASIGRA